MSITSTLVIPTFKENENLEPLVTRLFKALKAKSLDSQVEVIVVDDNSNDGSEATIEKLAAKGYNVRIIVRTTERGLSSAVLRGFDEASSSSVNLICMDADLQHPPEKVPELIEALRKGAQFVIGTRYSGTTAIDKDWPMHRRVLSGGARALAQPLSTLSDPMSGFFGINRRVYQQSSSAVSPIGYKIALELVVKGRCTRIAEVPINFGVRTAGESKLDGKVILYYLLHLWELYNFKFYYFMAIPYLLAFLFVWFVLL